MIDKISKLLVLAEGASTPAEAEACFAKAQALASAHAISLAEASALGAKKQSRTAPIHKTLTVGAVRKRANKHLILLMSAIARVNDVEINIASNSTYVILFGFPHDIETCETLWIHISHKMVQSGESYLATDEWRTPKGTRDHATLSYLTAPVTKQTARSSYYSGFVSSLAKRLQAAREEEVRLAEQRARAAEPSGAHATTSTTAIALRQKKEEVHDYYQRTSTARGTWGGDRRPTAYSARSAEAGQRDGRRIRLTDSGEVAGRTRSLSR